MAARSAYLLITLLLLLALTPWAISSCAQQPLLPEDLRQQPTRYQMTVDTSQNLTREAERAATSAPPKVVPLGTLAATPEQETPVPPAEAPAETFTNTLSAAAPAITPTLPISAELSLAPPVESTVVIVSSAVMTDTPEATPRVIVVRSQSGVADPTATPTTTPTLAASASLTATQGMTTTQPAPTATPIPPVVVAPATGAGPPTPSGMIDVEDILTDAALTAQMAKDAQGTDLSELSVFLDRNGVAAAGIVRIFPVFRRPITAIGHFAVENESLVVKITQILFNGADVTEEHRDALESNVNSSLYRLLPQRYVQSFEMGAGQVIVKSKMRP